MNLGMAAGVTATPPAPIPAGGSGWFKHEIRDEKTRISKDDDECLMIVKSFLVCESGNI